MGLGTKHQGQRRRRVGNGRGRRVFDSGRSWYPEKSVDRDLGDVASVDDDAETLLACEPLIGLVDAPTGCAWLSSAPSTRWTIPKNQRDLGDVFRRRAGSITERRGRPKSDPGRVGEPRHRLATCRDGVGVGAIGVNLVGVSPDWLGCRRHATSIIAPHYQTRNVETE